MNGKIKAVLASSLAIVSALSLMLFASAEDFDVGSAVTSGFSNVADDMLSMITSILPIGLGVIGAVLAVTFGIRFFKKLAGKG